MKILHFLMDIFIVIFTVSLVFFIELYCTAEVSTAIWGCMLLLSFVLIIAVIICSCESRLSFFFFKGKKGAISLITIIIIIVFNSFFVTAASNKAKGYIKGKLNASEKIKAYKNYLNNNLFYEQNINMKKRFKMKKLKYSYVNFYYNSEKDIKTIQLVESFLDQIDQDINDNLGIPKNHEVDVIVCPDKKTMDQDENGGGYLYVESINTIFIYDYDNSSVEEYKYLFNQAYYGYRITNFMSENNIWPEDVPAWFDEGLETYYIYNGQNIGYSPDDLKEPLDFRKLDKIEDFKKLESIQNYDPYLQSYYGVYYIIEKAGPEAIKDILIKTKEQGFYAALQTVTGMNIDELQKEYLKYRISEYNYFKNK